MGAEKGKVRNMSLMGHEVFGSQICTNGMLFFSQRAKEKKSFTGKMQSRYSRLLHTGNVQKATSISMFERIDQLKNNP
jgi:hypothetical protein